MSIGSQFCTQMIPTRMIAPFLRDKVIYCKKMQGIGNRLKYIISFLYLLQPKRFVLIWPSSEWVTRKFSDLMQFKWDAPFYEFSDFPGYREKYFISNNWLKDENWRLYVNERDVSPGPVRGYKPSMNGCSVDYAFETTPEAVLQRYLPFFKRFSPSSAVQRRMDLVALPEHCVAVQIRNEKKWASRGRNEPLDDFLAEMRQFPDDTQFYLSAMTPAISAATRAIFGDRIIELPGKDYSSMIDATADLFLLSKPSQAIYSFGSTFSEVAWWLGGGSQTVQLVGSPERWR